MKKNLILAIAGVLAVQISMAQTQKGAQTLGGYLSLAKGSNNNSQIDAFSNQTVSQKYSSTNFAIGPVYGLFVADNLELRGALQFSAASNRSTYTGPYANDVKQTSNNFGGSLAIMKYFMYNKLGLRVGPYAGYSRGVMKETNYTSTFTSTSHVDSYSAGAKADLVYYPSNHWALQRLWQI